MTESREAVATLAAKGADCIKAYNMLQPDALAAIRQAAAEAELSVIGHAPHSVSFEEAGLVDLQHGTGAVVVDRERVGCSDFRAATDAHFHGAFYSGVMDAVVALLKGQFAPDRDGTRNFSDPS